MQTEEGVGDNADDRQVAAFVTTLKAAWRPGSTERGVTLSSNSQSSIAVWVSTQSAYCFCFFLLAAVRVAVVAASTDSCSGTQSETMHTQSETMHTQSETVHTQSETMHTQSDNGTMKTDSEQSAWLWSGGVAVGIESDGATQTE